jgi:hypothetical protein
MSGSPGARVKTRSSMTTSQSANCARKSRRQRVRTVELGRVGLRRLGRGSATCAELRSVSFAQVFEGESDLWDGRPSGQGLDCPPRSHSPLVTAGDTLDGMSDQT